MKTPGAAVVALALFAAVALPADRAAANESDAVRVWNERAVATLTNGTAAPTPGAQFSPTVGFIHLAMVQGAVYDAVNAIKGGHDPYLSGIKAATSASKGAAAATAAHHVLIAIINQAPTTAALNAGVKSGIRARLDAQYAASLAEIADGEAKDKGIAVGGDAAAAMLANREGDGRFGAPGFPVAGSPGAGQWRPVAPSFGNDPNGWVRNVKPFALPRPEYFHTLGPAALTSAQYTAEFNEVKALGRATGSTRTPEQTMLAYFVASNPVPMAYGGLRQVSAAKGLTMAQEARFYAMTSMAGADSVINCFAEKAHWNFWRPTTAIQLADTDGNDATSPDPEWTALLAVPPYPEEPSGANCVFSGVMNSATAFFGDDAAEFEIASPGVGPGTGSVRHYSHFSDVIGDVIEARILGGLHYRRADLNGVEVGRKVAEYVAENLFTCRNAGQCKQEERE